MIPYFHYQVNLRLSKCPNLRVLNTFIVYHLQKMCKTQFKNNLCVLAIVDSHFKEPMPGLQKGSVQYNHALAHAHPQN